MQISSKLKKLIIRFIPDGFLLIDTYGKSEEVFLTFDDGPNSPVTIKLLDLLDKYQVKATFFCIGKNLNSRKDIGEEIVRRGHSLGNHSYNHYLYSKQPLSKRIAEIKQTNSLIHSLTGNQSVIPFRAPQGNWQALVLIWLLWKRIPAIHWTIDSLDSRSLPANEIENQLFNSIKGGEIILFHDDSPLSIEVLESLIPRLLSDGKRFGNLSDYLGLA